jgi:hypothetical protein
VKHPEKAEPVQTDQDQIDRDDKVQKPRHDQDQDACEQGHYGRNMRSGNRHLKSLRLIGEKANRGRQLTRWRGSGIEDARRLNGFPQSKKMPKIAAAQIALFRER